MAILKHIASKNTDYGKSLEYLMFEHTESGAPVRNSEGDMIMREQFLLDGINCNPYSYDKECEMLNAQVHKNQKYSDIKSHHYIISFDPADNADGKLTAELAHELGMRFARKHFPGHQILVCTHTDGHNGSGNIHVHIIFNSVRKLDVEKEPYMEREIDCCAGYKHHLTKGYQEAISFFREHCDGKVPSIKELKAEKEKLITLQSDQRKELSGWKQIERELQTAAENVDTILHSGNTPLRRPSRNQPER